MCSSQRELDTTDIFSVPVIESCPEVAKEYLRKIEEPMDFRTIEDRLSSYEHIAQMQDDLILTFRNCCTFNAEVPEFYCHAL